MLTRPLSVGVTAALLVLASCAGRTNPEPGGSADAAVCSQASVTLTLRAPPGYAGQYCVGAPNGCSNVWLSILAPDQSELEIDLPCIARCSDCEPVGCPASCALPSKLGEAGATRTWDGTYFARSTCSGMECQSPACAAPGHYTAKMCAYADTGQGPTPYLCSPVAEPTCTTVGFDWPPADGGTSTFEGTIGSVPDGGTPCCPIGWSLYGCTFPGGGAGHACHNPQMGCASSNVCGEGCDMVVTGACGG